MATATPSFLRDSFHGHAGIAVLFKQLARPLLRYGYEFRQPGAAGWTIVRPPRLANSALTTSYHVADGRLPKGMTVSRACVADFMVREVERPTHVRQIVGLSK